MAVYCKHFSTFILLSSQSIKYLIILIFIPILLIMIIEYPLVIPLLFQHPMKQFPYLVKSTVFGLRFKNDDNSTDIIFLEVGSHTRSSIRSYSRLYPMTIFQIKKFIGILPYLNSFHLLVLVVDLRLILPGLDHFPEFFILHSIVAQLRDIIGCRFVFLIG